MGLQLRNLLITLGLLWRFLLNPLNSSRMCHSYHMGPKQRLKFYYLVLMLPHSLEESHPPYPASPEKIANDSDCSFLFQHEFKVLFHEWKQKLFS